MVLVYGILFWFGPLALFKKYRFFKQAILVKGIISRTGRNWAEVCYFFDGHKQTTSIEYIPALFGKETGKQVTLAINPHNIHEICVKQFSASLRVWVLTLGWVCGVFCFIMYFIVR